MSWVSPTGYADPDSKWNNEANAYDGNTSSFAYTNYPGYYLELTHSAINCNKIRIYCDIPDTTDDNIDIDVYYGGAWHNIFSGDIPANQWVEKNIGSTQTVTKARVCSNKSGYSLYLYEFEFWEVEIAAPTVTTQNATGIGFD